LNCVKTGNEFTGDTEEAKKIGDEIDKLQKENIKLAQENAKKMENIKGVVNDVVTAVTDAVGVIAKSTRKAFDNKEAIVAARKNIDRLQILYQGIIETYDSMAESQRQLRDDEKNTIEERLAANEELQRVLKEGQEAELKNIRARKGEVAILLANNKNNVELQNELLQLKTDETGVIAKYKGLMSETLTNEVSLGKESIGYAKIH